MLDPDNQRVIDLLQGSGRPPLSTFPPAEARELYRMSRGPMQPDPPEMAEVRDLTMPGPGGEMALRLYRGAGTPEGPLPTLVFYHGGGYVIGDRDTHDYLCRKLANVAQCAVVSVDYRLAPEHKFPAAVEDAAAALRWVVGQAHALGLDPQRIAVGGDSAGGNLSAVMAHMARDGDVPELRFQLLLYPGTDMGMTHASYARDFRHFPLSVEACRYFLGHYLRGPEDVADWHASPLRAPSFERLPPAFVLTAGYDPLVDEGQDYARRIEAAGVPVTLVHFSDQMHGFLTMARMIRAADVALDMAGLALRRAFA